MKTKEDGMDRQSLRKRILGARDRLTAEDRHEKSKFIIQNFSRLPRMQQLATLFIYVNFRSEVETLELIKRCLNQGIREGVAAV